MGDESPKAKAELMPAWQRRSYPEITDQEIIDIVPHVTSYRAACRALGIYDGSGAGLSSVITRIKRLGLSTDHFTRIANGAHSRKIRTEILFSARACLKDPGTLIRRGIESGVLKGECSECRITEWRGHPVPLKLLHLNNDRLDNRVENLKLLCGNCYGLLPPMQTKSVAKRREKQILKHYQDILKESQ